MSKWRIKTYMGETSGLWYAEPQRKRCIFPGYGISWVGYTANIKGDAIAQAKRYIARKEASSRKPEYIKVET